VRESSCDRLATLMKNIANWNLFLAFNIIEVRTPSARRQSSLARREISKRARVSRALVARARWIGLGNDRVAASAAVVTNRAENQVNGNSRAWLAGDPCRG
jgi:hypothetical protein